MKQKGFTVIELVVAIVVFAAAGTVFFMQKQDLQTSQRDKDRKTAINAIYYSLEEVYYPAHSGYPRELNSKTVTAIDQSLLKDPNGVMIGEQSSQYRYAPSGCNGDLCKGYSLRADLEREADYVRNSRHN